MAESVAQIQAELKQIRIGELEKLDEFLQIHREDERPGVRKLVGQAEGRREKLLRERERLEQMRLYERDCAEKGFRLICGIDEAGRGPLAGPVVAGAVILPQDCEILGLNDSKKLSEARRNELFDEIRDKALAFGGRVSRLPPRASSRR